MTPLLLPEVVRGPEQHVRFGLSLFVEPTVETGRAKRFPSQAVIVTQAARRMIELSKAGERVESIVVTGDINPTIHPDFREISENLRELTAKWFPKGKLTLEALPTELDDPDVRIAIGLYHRPVFELSSGTQRHFAAQTGAPAGALRSAVEGMTKLELERLEVAAYFARGNGDNTTENEVKAWLGHVSKVKPASVQIYPSPRGAARSGARQRPVSKKRLEEIAEKVSSRGIPVEICSG